MKKIYCISGMGADERIFKKLEIHNYELVPVHWAPFDRSDNMQSYAQKLLKQIPDAKPILLGLSFGGMLAVEIGKIIATEKIFLVSSAKTSSELPRVGRIAIGAKFLKFIPERMFRKPAFINFSFAGAKNKEDQDLLNVMLRDTASGFIKWALQVVVEWNNNVYPPGIVQIHGTNDKIIPSKNVHPDYWIQGGGHIIIYNRAEEVGKIVAGCLSNG